MKRFVYSLMLFCISFSYQAVGQDYNVRNYGAVSDTTKLSTIAINKAITECFDEGGGRVIIPAGRYKSGTVTLKDIVELYLMCFGMRSHFYSKSLTDA